MSNDSAQPSAPSRYAPTTWGSTYTDLECPSGQLCMVRKLQPMDLMAGNLLGASDLLADAVSAKIAEANAGPQDHKKSQEKQREEDLTKLAAVIGDTLSKPENIDSMVDTVVCKAVVEPRVQMPPKEFSDREPNVVYVDSIAFMDKMFIFNWAMQGLDQLKQFRGEASGDVQALESGEDVSRPAE